jgi:hypothetical protein
MADLFLEVLPHCAQCNLVRSLRSGQLLQRQLKNNRPLPGKDPGSNRGG